MARRRRKCFGCLHRASTRPLHAVLINALMRSFVAHFVAKSIDAELAQTGKGIIPATVQDGCQLSMGARK